jgi:hypothetical protein
MAIFDAARFVDGLLAQWPHTPLLKSHDPPVRDQFIETLEAAYLASMESEEGRTLRFGLVLLTTAQVGAKGEKLVRLGHPRPLSVAELRRLAPATNLSGTFIAIELADRKPLIAGLLIMASPWSRLQTGERALGHVLPRNLVVTVAGPGTMSVSFSEILLVRIERGRQAIPSSNVLQHGPVHDHFRPLMVQLVREALPAEVVTEEALPHLTISNGGIYLRILAYMLRAVEDTGHGGTVLIVRDGEAAGTDKYVEMKYNLETLDPWADMVALLRHEFHEIESWKLIAAQEPAWDVNFNTLSSWRGALAAGAKTEDRLLDYARFLAGLSQVDGALLLTGRLRALGFGAVIKDLFDAPPVVWSARTEWADEPGLVEVRSDEYGTRHRSAMAICAAMDCVAFVVSKDGGVKAFKRTGDKVVLWQSVWLGPQAWSLTVEDLLPQLLDRSR